MADWVAVHGNGAISDFDSPVTIKHTPQGSIIMPSNMESTTEQSGIVHFVVPSAPNGNVTVQKVQIDDKSETSYVSEVQIYYSDDLMWQKTDLKESTDVIDLDVTSFSAESVTEGNIGNGIGVSLTIVFTNGKDSSFSIWSLGLLFDH